MSGLITGYTPKSQNFIDTDLFDVSKHVTQTSGVLEVGIEYTILDFNTGDNFSNVATVISGVINTTGCVFLATGTTPTTYTNGSTLAKYVTQSYTYAELKAGLGLGSKVYKALLTQTGTSAPVATVLVNNLSGTPVWSYDSAGFYKLTLAGEFILGKTIYNIVPSDNSANSQILASLFNGAPDVFQLETRSSGVLTNEVLYSTPITIEVFP